MSKIVNYLNLQNAQTFSYDKKIKSEANLKDKKIPIISRLHYSDIISHSFKISNKLPREELLVKTELKMYEDIGLDPTKSYKISYIEKNRISDSEVLIEAFAVDKGLFTEKYQHNLKSIKHIDYLAISFLAYHTLYTNNIIDPKNDIFVYISKDEAFTASYKDGNYISSKRIKSISDMVNDLKNRNITISIDELCKTITTKGLDKNSYDLLQYDLHEYLVESFEELFSKIKNLSLHNRNVYNFTQIDRVFISCCGKSIPFLTEYVQSYTDQANFETLDFLQTKDIDTLDAISASYGKDKILDNDNNLNMSFFEKKDPFYKSEIGKFTFAALASSLLLSIYPTYLYLEIDKKINENEVLKQQEQTIRKSSKKLKTQLKKIKDEIAKTDLQKKDDIKQLKSLQSIANSLLELKSKDTKYTEMFLKINKVLKNYHLSLNKISQTDDHTLDLELSSKENKRDTIALLMKDLLNNGFSSVTSHKIALSDDDQYRSIVKVRR
jgi:hypothetical protein